MIIFNDRRDAGVKLARKMESTGLDNYKNPIVLGIPRGGLAVGAPIADMLCCPLEPVTLRKLPLPLDPQMGFGAVNIDKEVIVNQDIVDRGFVSGEDIKDITDEVYREVQRRDRVYRGNKPFPKLEDRHVIIADDGLATGYTMLAAVRFARGRNARKVTAAVPVSHFEAYNLVVKEMDSMICLYIDRGFSFAVAAFYDSFPDMSDEEVIGILKTAKI
jgi:putative phosphoribosyl transferase